MNKKAFIMSSILTMAITFFVLFLISVSLKKEVVEDKIVEVSEKKEILKKSKKINKEIKNKKYSLNINTNNKNSKIRILNIKPRYKKGILLKNGKYHIDIKSKGYQSLNFWITIENKNIVINKDLKKVIKKSTLVVTDLFDKVS